MFTGRRHANCQGVITFEQDVTASLSYANDEPNYLFIGTGRPEPRVRIMTRRRGR